MNLTRAVRTLGERAGHPNLRNHDLRHFHVSQSLNLGVPIPEASARVGHADLAITLKVYAHLLPGTEPAAPDVIDEAMSNFGLDSNSEPLDDESVQDRWALPVTDTTGVWIIETEGPFLSTKVARATVIAPSPTSDLSRKPGTLNNTQGVLYESVPRHHLLNKRRFHTRPTQQKGA